MILQLSVKNQSIESSGITNDYKEAICEYIWNGFEAHATEVNIDYIHKKKKWMAEGVFDKIISITEKDTKRKAVENAKEYILGNWSGIMISMKSKDTNVRCSAEGHVSHVYADRMSSRPLGWCRVGADKMSRLRIYRYNQGDMLELVRFQKKELKQVAGAEEVIYSATEMLRMEKKNRKKLGALADLPVYSIPYAQVKKIAAIKNHIWGL